MIMKKINNGQHWCEHLHMQPRFTNLLIATKCLGWIPTHWEFDFSVLKTIAALHLAF